jgi:hypothetical protein
MHAIFAACISSIVQKLCKCNGRRSVLLVPPVRQVR